MSQIKKTIAECHDAIETCNGHRYIGSEDVGAYAAIVYLELIYYGYVRPETEAEAGRYRCLYGNSVDYVLALLYAAHDDTIEAAWSMQLVNRVLGDASLAEAEMCFDMVKGYVLCG